MKYNRQLSRYFLITSFLLLFGYFKGFNTSFDENLGFWGTPLGFMFLFSIVQFSIFAVASYFIQLNFYVTSLNKGNAEEKKIALTFDDGPDSEITLKLLEILDKYNVKASFFIIGKKAEKHQEIVKQIVEKGHIVANHSYSHKNTFPLQTAKKIASDIEKCNTIIKNITGKKPKFFRPPFGVTNPMIAKAINKTNMISVGWSYRTYDTVKSKEVILKKLKVKNGDVILFHDTNKNIAEICDIIIPELQSQGYEFVDIEKLFNVDAYAED